jgi:4-hydroxybenzoate polyprenyltransferase/geranylgeranylglycerol-phosphate geranylgeranyltransferase
MPSPKQPLHFSFRDKIFAHLETWRPYTVIWCGLVSLTGCCFAFGDSPPLKIALLALFIPMMGWIAGLYLSDYLDRELDRIQKPHRPIPSGRIKPNEALFVGALFALTGFLLSFLLTFNNILLVFVVAILVFSYAKLSKSRGILGNLNRGFVIIVAYFFGLFSIDQPFSSIPLVLWLFSCVFFVHDTNSNLIGAIRDIQGDKKGGYQTIPVRYGVKTSLIISLLLSIVYLSLLIILIIYFWFLPYPYRFLPLFLLEICILITMYLSMFRSIEVLDRQKSLRAHEFFVAERTTLASALLLGVISMLSISISLFLLAMLVTLGSQYLIRKKYEFVEST